jgi:hypothetical protein
VTYHASYAYQHHYVGRYLRIPPEERGRERFRQILSFWRCVGLALAGGLVALVLSAATLFLMAPKLFSAWKLGAYWPMRDALVRLSALREVREYRQGTAAG